MLRCLQLLPGLKKHDVIALQGDNTTALAYVKNLGGTQSPQCYKEARAIWLWAEKKEVKLVPRFIAGCLNVEADALSNKSTNGQPQRAHSFLQTQEFRTHSD